jgi:phosphoribosylanthranilate isomerase
VDFHLFDTRVDGLQGGSGQAWDWALARRRRSKVPLILSGGMTPANVAEGAAAVDPYAVDVASGVEASPGVKDPEKVRAFLEAAHATDGAVA